MKLRSFFLATVRPVSRLLGEVRLRVGAPTLSSQDFYTLSTSLQPGDIILTRTKWRPTNIFIPGYWSHALLYVGGPTMECIEATNPVSQRSTLFDVMGKADFLTVLRDPDLLSEEVTEMLRIADQYVGIPYDYMFAPSPKELYCSELVYLVYGSVLGDRNPIQRKKISGELSVSPQGIYDTPGLNKIFDSR